MKSKPPGAKVKGVPSLPGKSGAILDFLGEFVRESGIDDPLVRVTLDTGETFFFYGLRIDASAIVTGSVMLRWLASPSVGALIVHEDQVARVEFEILPPEPPPPPPLGFHAYMRVPAEPPR